MAADPSNMAEVLRAFPQQCKESMALAKGIKVSGKVSKIVVCGMGGSAIGGNLLRTFMEDKGLPVFLVRDYTLPSFVDESTLVFAVSYSGNTEETLSCVVEAKNKKAKIIAITTGGKLADLAETCITVPTGLQPRNAISYLFFPMIGVLYNSSLIKVQNADINEMLKVISNVAAFEERAKDLAKRIKEKTPIIYSSTRMEVAAYRFKCEINENAKHPAYHHAFPELCHNELVGYQGMERSKFIVFMIRGSLDHDRIKKRMDICKKIFEDRVDVEEVKGMGNSLLAQLFSVIYLGDWISYYLAVLKRVDPTPVYIIEHLKKELLK